MAKPKKTPRPKAEAAPKGISLIISVAEVHASAPRFAPQDCAGSIIATGLTH